MTYIIIKSIGTPNQLVRSKISINKQQQNKDGGGREDSNPSKNWILSWQEEINRSEKRVKSQLYIICIPLETNERNDKACSYSCLLILDI